MHGCNCGNNTGLNLARDALEPIKAKFPKLSCADLHAFAGFVAVKETGGPKIEFATGWTDDANGSKSDPNDQLPCVNVGSMNSTVAHVWAIFGHMGFNDQEIVALLGAHAMGCCHADHSGFWGPWTNAEMTFWNEHFRLLAEECWSPKLTHNFKPWTGSDQFEDATGNLMMLPADIANGWWRPCHMIVEEIFVVHWVRCIIVTHDMLQRCPINARD